MMWIAQVGFDELETQRLRSLVRRARFDAAINGSGVDDAGGPRRPPGSATSATVAAPALSGIDCASRCGDCVTICGFPLIPGSGHMWVSDGGGRAECNGGRRFEVLQDLHNCCSPH